MTAPLTVDQLQPRIEQLTVIDVRSAGEFAGGHIPGAYNVPLDRLSEALPALRAAAARGELAVTCASGARASNACEQLAAAGIPALLVDGGTAAWTAGGGDLNRAAGAKVRWAMDRQVRLVAASLVLAGVLVDLAVPGARWVSAAVGGGLLFSAVSNTCAMGMLLGKLPYNRPRDSAAAFAATLTALRDGNQ
ncbi:rhodanese-like domain-containing protein [Streptomyces sp. TLI_171]|uniref:rhodanese-like domain-containing protein n=1 Tax=Streptomyces sp. TLI_171 TaxID=1938859 RepID=UPI000C190A0F|nr:rhodanese-like domain-containing protein [Streptomyces sp. TLI_171]RKE22902.1 rhodanese-related sulfurtransferase [Streptomyces sp. TLI_171]